MESSLDANSRIDSSFNGISLVVDVLKCYNYHIQFKTIHANVYFDLNGNVETIKTETKVSFGPSCQIKLFIPENVTLSDSVLKINKLEFNLTNSNPILHTNGNFSIIGEDANIESLFTDITLNIDNCGELRFGGTWKETKHSKFFVVDTKNNNLSLLLDSENIPLMFHGTNIFKIVLGNANVSVFGTLHSEFISGYTICTSVTERVTFKVERLYFRNDANTLVTLNSSNIDMIVENLYGIGEKTNRYVIFDL